MRSRYSFLLLLPPLLAGCAAESPFIYTEPPTPTLRLEKPRNELAEFGHFRVCHASQTPMSEVAALAQEQCAAYGLQMRQNGTQRWQCRTTASHLTSFSCVDPQMTDAEGNFVNPFDKRAVAEWEKRAGKKAKLINPNQRLFPNAGLPAAVSPTLTNPQSGETSPQAGTASTPILTPEDIAGKPPQTQNTAPATAPAAIAPAQPAPPPAGHFSLPQGSWGDAFEQ